ncbi:hypothetical protein L7F22_045759 [Adiantum nelumboides]|nr:hypothetical protein [Adiantum nelumboides]
MAANWIICVSRHSAFFFHVGTRTNSGLFTTMFMGREKTFILSHKVCIIHSGGSIFLLIAALTMSFYNSEVPSFDIQDFDAEIVSSLLEILIYVGFLIAYAVKLPIFPFHTWLPDTHGEAHYSTSMLLAGGATKNGNSNYLCLSNFDESAQFQNKNSLFFGFSYGFCNNWNRFFDRKGIDGAILQMISHGLIGAALFFLAGPATTGLEPIS